MRKHFTIVESRDRDVMYTTTTIIRGTKANKEGKELSKKKAKAFNATNNGYYITRRS